MKNYIIFKQQSTLDPNVYTYGIKHQTEDCFVCDISTDEYIVSHMCDVFNQNDLSPVHLKDAVEDFLAVI